MGPAAPRMKIRQSLLLASVVALTIGAALAMGQERVAQADIQSLTLDTNVVLGTGTVVATFTADEDAEAVAEAVRIYMPNPLVTSLTEDDCTTSLGADCAIAAENPCVDPAPPANTFCGQYVPVASIDGDSTPGTFTASFSIEIDCTNDLGLVGIPVTVENLLDTDGFNSEDSETALIHCFPNTDGANANVTINKDFDGDPAQTFEYQLNTTEPGGGCFVSIDGGPATLVVDGGTFTMTAADDAWLFCGQGTYDITELQGIGWIFVSSGCEQLTPAQQPIPGSTVTVVIESTNPWDCVFTNAEEDPTIPDLLIEKVCVGEADATFAVDFIRDAGPGVTNPIECDGFLYFPDLLAADYTIEELIDGPDAGAIETSIDCGEAGTSDTASIVVTVPSADSTPATNITCVLTNTFTGDNPETPDIIVKKECVGDLGDATFSIVVRATTQPIECGTEVTFPDVAAGEVEVSEAIEGGDGIQTQIACSDLTQAEGTTVTLTVPEPAEGETAVDIFCVFINSAEDIGDLFCSCTCCGLELDIDLNNNNTNTIGIDNDNTNNNANDNDNANFNNNENKNKNGNQNENTQDQTNSQDQDNENSQTNNITSSPEVNIDFDE